MTSECLLFSLSLFLSLSLSLSLSLALLPFHLTCRYATQRYNILDGKKEVEHVLAADDEMLIVKDYKWSDESKLDAMHFIYDPRTEQPWAYKGARRILPLVSKF